MTDRLAVRGFGFGAAALCFEGNAEIDPRERMIGVGGAGTLQQIESRRVAAVGGVVHGERVEGGEIPGLGQQGPLQKGDRFVLLASTQQRYGEGGHGRG